MADVQPYWRGALEKGIPEHPSCKLAGQEEKRLHLSESGSGGWTEPVSLSRQPRGRWWCLQDGWKHWKEKYSLSLRDNFPPALA